MRVKFDCATPAEEMLATLRRMSSITPRIAYCEVLDAGVASA
jgi:hypothetical protein